MTLTDTYTLNNGIKIPKVGFGTWQSASGEEAYNAVKTALEAGYRHIDTAAVYKNEESVGQAIADSGIPREELFVTTKLWGVGTTEDAAKALDESLKNWDLIMLICTSFIGQILKHSALILKHVILQFGKPWKQA